MVLEGAVPTVKRHQWVYPVWRALRATVLAYPASSAYFLGGMDDGGVTNRSLFLDLRLAPQEGIHAAAEVRGQRGDLPLSFFAKRTCCQTAY